MDRKLILVVLVMLSVCVHAQERFGVSSTQFLNFKPAPTRPVPPAPTAPPAPVSAATKDPVCFAFHANSVFANQADSLVKQFATADRPIMIGVDDSHEGEVVDGPQGKMLTIGSTGQNFAATAQRINAAAKREVLIPQIYLMGPGMPSWGGGTELKLMKKNARQICQVLKKSNCESDRENMEYWSEGGWLDFSKQRLLLYAKAGYKAYEFDNLDQPASVKWSTGENRSGKKLVALLLEMQRWMTSAGIHMAMTLKNLSRDQILELHKAIYVNKILNRNMISSSAILEPYGSDDRGALIGLMKEKLGVYALPSISGNPYHATDCRKEKVDQRLASRS